MTVEGTVDAGGDQAETEAVQPPVADETEATEATPGADEAASSAEATATDDLDLGDDDDQLLTPSQIEEYRKDPDKFYKEINRAFTQKRQGDAVAVKLFKALQGADKEQVIAAIAGQMGLVVGKKPPKEETFKPLVDIFGEEGARQVVPAISQIIQEHIDKAVGPIKEQQERNDQATAVTQSKAVMAEFSTRHPDWKKYEDRMTKIGMEFIPAKAIDPGKYLDMLYRLATEEATEAKATRAAVDRMGRAAANTGTAGGTSQGKVATAPRKVPTFKEAADAAKRGIRFEE